MKDLVTMTLHIKGHFPDDTFPEWIINRATRLSLSGWVQKHSDNLIEIFVSGDRILVEALEVACSLGPIDAQVDTIDGQSAKTPATFYRQPHQFIRYLA